MENSSSRLGVTWVEFEWRFRVANGSGAGYTMNWWQPPNVQSNASDWSPWANFTASMAQYWANQWPNSALGWTTLYTVVGLYGQPENDTSDLELQLEVQPAPWSPQPTINTTTLSFVLGPFVSLSMRRVEIMLGPAPTANNSWAPIQSSGQFNHNAYFASLFALAPPLYMTQNFPLADYLACTTDEVLVYADFLTAMRKVGVTAVETTSMSPAMRTLFEQYGMPMGSGAVYTPATGYFDYEYNASVVEVRTYLLAWANKTFGQAVSSGWNGGQLQAVAFADEPGFYMPYTYWESSYSENPFATARFSAYLQAQNLTPAEVNASSWSTVGPLGRGSAYVWNSTESRTRYYWSMRFFSWDSARFLGEVAYAMSQLVGAAPPGQCSPKSASASSRCLNAFYNANNFQGRRFSPGPFGNNPTRTSIESAMLCEDWLEASVSVGLAPSSFAPAVGALAPSTEDWFTGDWENYEWSYMATRLRAGAQRSGSGFGGYVVGRSEQTCFGIVQREMALVGHGASYVRRYTFGPEYEWPGNTYSQSSPALWPGMLRSGSLLGFLEATVVAGQPRAAGVGLLSGRSSQFWDAWGEAQPTWIEDVTNADEFSSTPLWSAEQFGLYFALALTAGIPVDVVDEDTLSASLPPLSVLLATAPDLPEASTAQIVAAVRAGGLALFATSGAGGNGRYGLPPAAPATTLWAGLGVREATPMPRQGMSGPAELAWTANVTFTFPDVPSYALNLSALGPVGALAAPLPPNATVLGTFGDPSADPLAPPALVTGPAGLGSYLWMGTLPGVASQACDQHGGSTWGSIAAAVLLRQAVQNATALQARGNAAAAVDNWWRVAPVGISCSPALPPLQVVNSSVPGLEARLIDAPGATALLVTNWTTSAGFAFYAASYTPAWAECTSTAPNASWSVTVALPAPSSRSASCVHNVTVYGALQPVPFSAALTPSGLVTLVSFQLPIEPDANAAIIAHACT